MDFYSKLSDDELWIYYSVVRYNDTLIPLDLYVEMENRGFIIPDLNEDEHEEQNNGSDDPV